MPHGLGVQLLHLGLCACTRRCSHKTHFSERVPIIKRGMTVFKKATREIWRVRPAPCNKRMRNTYVNSNFPKHSYFTINTKRNCLHFLFTLYLRNPVHISHLEGPQSGLATFQVARGLLSSCRQALHSLRKPSFRPVLSKIALAGGRQKFQV